MRSHALRADDAVYRIESTTFRSRRASGYLNPDGVAVRPNSGCHRPRPPKEIGMNKILSLQMLPIASMNSGCLDSAASCPSDASCESHESADSVPTGGSFDPVTMAA